MIAGKAASGKWTYLNNAATSYPKPPEVIEAVIAGLTSVPGTSGRTTDGSGGDQVEKARETIRLFFNGPARDQVIFTSGATEALNIAILGMDLEGSHVITTAMEHNSMLRPLFRLRDEGTIDLTIVGCDVQGRVSPDAITEAIVEGTKLVCVNHASNVTGAVNDIRSISKIVHDAGARLLVDGSQTAGYAPVDVAGWGIDAFAFTGHKNLFGLTGSGGLVLNGDVGLRPIKVGGTGVRSDLEAQPPELPSRLEAGTPNLPGIISLDAGVGYILREGMERLRQVKEIRTMALLEGLEEIPGTRIFGRPLNGEGRGLMSFRMAAWDVGETGYILGSSYGVIARTGLHCAPLVHRRIGSHPEGTVRLSPSSFTTEEEIERTLQALRAMAGGGA